MITFSRTSKLPDANYRATQQTHIDGNTPTRLQQKVDKMPKNDWVCQVHSHALCGAFKTAQIL